MKKTLPEAPTMTTNDLIRQILNYTYQAIPALVQGMRNHSLHSFRKPHKIKDREYRTSNQGSRRDVFLKLSISFTNKRDTMQAHIHGDREVSASVLYRNPNRFSQPYHQRRDRRKESDRAFDSASAVTLWGFFSSPPLAWKATQKILAFFFFFSSYSIYHPIGLFSFVIILTYSSPSLPHGSLPP